LGFNYTTAVQIWYIPACCTTAQAKSNILELKIIIIFCSQQISISKMWLSLGNAHDLICHSRIVVENVSTTHTLGQFNNVSDSGDLCAPGSDVTAVDCLASLTLTLMLWKQYCNKILHLHACVRKPSLY